MTPFEPTQSGLLSRWIPSRPWRITLISLVMLGLAGVAAIIILAILLTPSLPPLTSLGEDSLKVPLRVYTADNVLIGEFGDERRIPVTAEEVPPLLIEAILAAEDDGFYRHYGVDFMGIARAAWINFRSGSRSQGASTITMQVARNFFLSPERTYTRKFKEILLSMKLERELSKNQILELYMNKIFLGHRAYGFAAAAEVYYGKNLKELNLPEMAMLAGLPKAPSRNNPVSRPKTALERRNYVLRRMETLGFIDNIIYHAAIDAPLAASKHGPTYEVDAPYIAEMVRQHMMKTYDEQTYGGGFSVYTTILAKHQRAANEALRKGLLAYDQRHGYRGRLGHLRIKAKTDKAILDEALNEYYPVGNLTPAIVRTLEKQSAMVYTQDGEDIEIPWTGLSWARRQIDQNIVGRAPKKAADVVKPGDIIYVALTPEGTWQLAQEPDAAAALVALEPTDGAILALVGGFDFYAKNVSGKYNRVIQASRQAGSNIKPFLYSAALNKGFTAASTISGAPISVQDASLEEVWQPHNYSGKFHGPTRLRKALRLSINLVSVRLLRAIGADYSVNYFTRFGFERSALPRNLSLALGSASVTPLAMARAFGVFANGGFLVQPYFIKSIVDSEGQVLMVANPVKVCLSCPESRMVQVAETREQDGDSTAPGDKTADAETKTDTASATETETETETENEDAADDTQDNDLIVSDHEQLLIPPSDNPPPARNAPRVITAQNSYIMTSIMQDVVKRGTATRAMELKRRDLAGKTGTTNEYRDAWFSGYNTSIVATTWVGFDQPKSLGRGEAGSRAALPIWIEYMRYALENIPDRPTPMPPGIVKHFIDADTGEIVAGPDDTQEDLATDSTASDTKDATAADKQGSDDESSNNDASVAEAQEINIMEEYFVAGQEGTAMNLLSGTDTQNPDGTSGSSGNTGSANEDITQDLF